MFSDIFLCFFFLFWLYFINTCSFVWVFCLSVKTIFVQHHELTPCLSWFDNSHNILNSYNLCLGICDQWFFFPVTVTILRSHSIESKHKRKCVFPLFPYFSFLSRIPPPPHTHTFLRQSNRKIGLIAYNWKKCSPHGLNSKQETRSVRKWLTESLSRLKARTVVPITYPNYQYKEKVLERN